MHVHTLYHWVVRQRHNSVHYKIKTMQASRASRLTQCFLTFLIVVLNNADLLLANYQPHHHYGPPKYPMRSPMLGPPHFPPKPPQPLREPPRQLYPARAQPLYPTHPIYTQTRAPVKDTYYTTVPTTQKPQTTTTIATTTAKLELQLPEDSLKALLTSMEKDESLKIFNMSSTNMKKMVKNMWPVYKKTRKQILEKEKIRSEMQQLRKQYFAKKGEFRQWNRLHKSSDIL